MAATTEYTRALLRRIYRSAETDGLSLLEALNAFNDSRVIETATGNQIISVSANGNSTTFASPSASFSQNDLVESAGRLLDLYDVVVASGNTTDADRYGAMMLRLKPAKSFRFNFFGMRFR